MLLDYLLLPAIFLIGLVTSYQDCKEGKIKNKWIVLGLVWGLGIYFLFLIFGLLSFSYVFKVLINSIIALIFGYILWYFNLWSAGDAKLFFIFSLLLPLEYYWRSALPYFPSFVLLINIFIPILLFLICQNLVYFFKKALAFGEIRPTLEEKFLKLKNQLKANYLSYSKIGFGFLLIFLLFQLINFEFANRFSQLGSWSAVIFLLIIVFRKFLSQILKKNWFLVLVLLGIIFYGVAGQIFYSQEMLPRILLLVKGSILFMFIFIIISALLSYIPEEQKKHLPFAIWILIGTLITIILKGSLVSFFLNPTAFLK